MFIVHPSNNSGNEQQQRNDFLFDSLLINRINKKNLAPALMKFYTDVEQTGGSNEFYDKFSIRHHIQVILSSLWNDQHYRTGIYGQQHYLWEYLGRKHSIDTKYQLNLFIAVHVREKYGLRMVQLEVDHSSKNSILEKFFSENTSQKGPPALRPG